MAALSTRTLFAVGWALAWAGCYHDLDYSHIKCDVTAKNPCPDGYLCGPAATCVRPGAADAPLSEGGVSVADVEDTDQRTLDTRTPEASPPVDVSTGPMDIANAIDTTLGTTLDGSAADKPEEIATVNDGGAGP